MRFGWARLAALVVLAAVSGALHAQRPEPPPLPEIPGTPIISGVTYPDCREDYRDHGGNNRKAEATNTCIAQLDAYHAAVLADFRQRMLAHQQAIGALYGEQVQNNFDYTQEQADDFFARTTQEHEDSNPDGRHMETYRTLEARYQDDRAYLQERYCRYAGNCDDYVPTAETAERDREDGITVTAERRESRRRERQTNTCRTERTGGGLFGSILGGVVGEAVGLGAAGGAIVGSLGGVLVAEIACQLTEEEQEQVAEATETVTAQEEVGATAEWVSPTRTDVSGSSTVTAMTSQPNGSRCMDVSDIIIVEGEETRISKRMCREPGESRYTLAA